MALFRRKKPTKSCGHEQLLSEMVIKDSMILEYKQALEDAHFKIAFLNGKLKLLTTGTASK